MIGLHSLDSVGFGIDFILQPEPLMSLHELIAMKRPEGEISATVLIRIPRHIVVVDMGICGLCQL
jgi:hypothetical protein